MILTKGQRVKLTADGRTVDAEIVIASPNGRSLMLAFEALLDDHIGMMPVFLEDNGIYYAMMTGNEVKIEAL